MKKKLTLKNINEKFDIFAQIISKFVGTTAAFLLAIIIVIVWFLAGPLFNYSDTWQLIINTGTTIITFIMVFLIQRSQNRDSLALQLKLNELVASSKFSSNRLIDIEGLNQEELEMVHTFYSRLAKKAKNETKLKKSYSLDEIEKLSKRKKR